MTHSDRAALDHLDHLDDRAVAATTGLAELRTRLDHPLGDQGADPVRVIDDLVVDTAGGILGSAGGRFFGWVTGGALPAALAADWLTSVWDQNAALYACGPAEAVIEEIAGRWLQDCLGIPATASFAFVPGCQMAHVTCLAAARHSLLARSGWDVERDGLNGAPAIRIVTSGERHGSIDRAARLLGLGQESIRLVPADTNGQLTVDALESELSDCPDSRTIVILQAGDLNIGAFDPFNQLIPVAHRYGAWVHIDGAFGLWAAASPTYRHKLNGAAEADSWATDGHKWLCTQIRH